ncbi:MAG: aminopeptidase P family N-terminal domain-containing protein, partial [Dorea sp.]|nr:aminopeptidase P family N-terminal domain-containing protein [Dorea sp.]
MNKTVNERIAALQKRMKEENIDIYLVPTSDYHQSEYVGNYFKSRQYLTGFTGSAGTAVVTRDECYLWTDGRYFIQAELELAGTSCKLMKMGQPGVPTISQFLEEHLPKHCVLGFDGRTISMLDGLEYMHMVDKKHGRVRSELDLIQDIWVGRPSRSMDPVFSLDLKYAGESTASKLAR